MKYLILTGLLLPQTLYAFFCPNNFNIVDFGNSIDQVRTQCGKADKEEKQDVTPEGPQEWSYFIPQTVSTDTLTQTSGTLKLSFAFDKDGKAVNISANGIGVGATTLCGSNVQLGDTRDSVKSACGQPSSVNKDTGNAGEPPKPIKQVILIYSGAKLVFEDGVLVRKE